MDGVNKRQVVAAVVGCTIAAILGALTLLLSSQSLPLVSDGTPVVILTDQDNSKYARAAGECSVLCGCVTCGLVFLLRTRKGKN
jgi:hypothetical protein